MRTLLKLLILFGVLGIVFILFTSHPWARTPASHNLLKKEVTADDFNDPINKANDYISLGRLSTELELNSVMLVRKEAFTENSSRYYIGYIADGKQLEINPDLSVGNFAQVPIVRTLYDLNGPVQISVSTLVEVVLYKQTQIAGFIFEAREAFSENPEATGKLLFILRWTDLTSK